MDDLRDIFPEPYAGDEAISSSDVAHAVEEIISDRYLNQAVGACCTENNGRLLISKLVKDLIACYAPADRPTMNWIPQECRRQFLNELASITGRALPPDEPIQAEPACIGLDTRLIANGYEPIAVHGKVPVAKGWNTRSSTVEAIAAERAEHPSAANTGLRTGRLVGVDIDIVPAEHVVEIKRLAAECLGVPLLERVGAKGAMLCYRNGTPIAKITISGKHPTQPGKVEILGAGQQFVAYGDHPDTGRPYTWTNISRGGEPLQTPLDQLPEVTPDKLRDFADRVAALLTDLGYTDVRVSGGSEPAERVRLDAPVNLEFDTPFNIERARAYLLGLVEGGDVAVEGEGGDNRTYRVVIDLRDVGLSPRTALELLLEPGGWNEHCVPPWKPNDLAVKVRNAYKYEKSAPGTLAFPGFPVEWVKTESVGATASAPTKKLGGRFDGRWPDEYEALPELTFWDDDNTLPRFPDGCVLIIYGEFGSHKTNTVIAMVLDAVLNKGARVCYAAGEGAHGVGKERIPAHCRAREIETKDLRERLCIVSAVPLFMSPDQVGAFIEAQMDFRPHIVVLDTLATALAGEDENSSRAAAFLTANGPAGRIRDAFKALVILPAHQGKDAGKKVRGHSGLMGNADVVLHVEANKVAGAIKVTVEKMRDGRDGFSIFFQVPPTGSPTVPVPKRITEEQYLALIGTTSARPNEAQLTFGHRQDVLLDEGANSFDRGLSKSQFAELLTGPRPLEGDVEALAKWKAQVAQERTSLKNAHGKSQYKGVLCDRRVPTDGKKMQWRWFIVNPAAAGTRSAAPKMPVDAAKIFAAADHGVGLQSPGGASAAGYPS